MDQGKLHRFYQSLWFSNSSTYECHLDGLWNNRLRDPPRVSDMVPGEGLRIRISTKFPGGPTTTSSTHFESHGLK